MNTRPQFSIFLCPDACLLLDSIAALLANNPPHPQTTWKKLSYWADEPLPPSCWDNLTLGSLLAEHKAIVIRHAELLQATAWKELSQSVLQTAEHIWPIICFELPLNREQAKIPAHIQKSLCYQRALKNKWLVSIPGLDSRSFPLFLRTQAKRLHLTLQDKTIQHLAAALPHDGALAAGEMEKLALLADKTGKLPDTFTEMLSCTSEIHLFELIRVLERGNAPKQIIWGKVFSECKEAESAFFSINSLLLREARLLWQCLSGEPTRLPTAIAAEKKIIAHRLGLKGIAKLWHLCLLADKRIKCGETSPEQSLEELIAQLVQLFSYNELNSGHAAT